MVIRERFFWCVDGCENQAQLLILEILLHGFYELEYCRLCDIMTNPDVNICQVYITRYIYRLVIIYVDGGQETILSVLGRTQK
jgi:hypothetical protein